MLEIKKLFSIAVLLFVLSCISANTFDRVYYEHINCTIVLVLFGAFLFYKGYKNRSLLLIFITNVLMTFSSAYYDIALFEVLTIILKLLSAFLLLIYIFPKQKNIKTSSVDVFTYLYLIIINGYLIYCLITMVSPYIDVSYLDNIFYFYALVLVCLGMAAFRYFLKGNFGSKSFSILVTFFVLSDIVGMLAYYLRVYSLFYIERLFYILALTYLIIHTIKVLRPDIYPQKIEN